MKIKSHRDIINIWPSTAVLLKRISEEFPELDDEKIRRLGNTLRMSKSRNNIERDKWEYLIKVSGVDYDHGRIKNMVTAKMLLDCSR